MKLQLLPSTFEDGEVSRRQHLTCFVIDDAVAIDAGSLAMAATATQRRQIRDIVLTHAHLDHVAGLPLFIDDLFSTLTEPVTVHATQPVIEILERDIFNWSVYPRFSELSNANGPVLKYEAFGQAEEFTVKNLTIRAIEVNHKVPSSGFVISDRETTIALTGDTAGTDGFWNLVNAADNLSAILLECAFPDELDELAVVSHHLTPRRMKLELEKCDKPCPVFVVNLKPMFREAIVGQISELGLDGLSVLEVGKVYEW
ncbi:MAG TPA: 3',5'-cyclic-nucleotide phosphodiesterase [Pyrinomonadaceae bacterium]|nr:3',5'-cyclic-nucleotide phosphodiesterase [Pyrinomonadaceae bacterium]